MIFYTYISLNIGLKFPLDFTLLLQLRNTMAKGTGKKKGKGKMPFKLRIRCEKQTEASRSTKTSSNSKTTNWRHKMKATNPERYKEILQQAKNYNKLERLEMSLAETTLRKRKITEEERKKAEKYMEKKKKYNMKTAKRMAKHRAKKKAEEQKRGNRLTRSEQIKREQHLKADAKRQRDRRAAMTTEEKEQVLAKRRVQYHEQKVATRQKLQEIAELRKKEEELKERERQVNEMQQKLRLREEELEALASYNGEDTRRPAARRKSLQRARSSLPKDPAQYVSTCLDLYSKASPRKKAIFDKHGVGLHNPGVPDRLCESIAQEMAKSKKSRKKEDVTRRRNFAGLVSIMKKYRRQGQAAKMLHIGRQAIKSAKFVKKGQHGNKTAKSVVSSVVQFYEENAVYLPDKKYISKKTMKKTGFLQHPVSTLFSSFKEKHPNIKIGLKKFYKLRPDHIKLQGAIKFRGCLCEYCTNIELKATAVNKVGNSYGLPSFFHGVYGVSRVTMCPKDGRKYYRRSCIERKCESCGVQNLRSHVAKLTDVHGTKSMTYKKWERTTCQEGGKVISKQVIQTKTTSLAECIDEMIEESTRLSAHLHNASWQSHQFSDLTKDVPDGSAVMVLDFAENFVCQYQDEIQSAHWYHSTATIHPVYCYYNCPEPNCGDTVHESLVYITSDKQHDYHAVHEFMSGSISHLKGRIPNLNTVIRFSDQCAAQYKSRGPFLDISNAEEEYGLYVQHHYFGSRHGKGPSDGETAVVKRMASSAIAAGRAEINNAKDLYDFCTRDMTRDSNEGSCQHFRRKFFFIEEVNRDRGHNNVALRTIKGTRLLHSIRGHMEGRMYTRNLSCFCNGCTNMGICQNKEYVDPWMTEVLFKLPASTSGEYLTVQPAHCLHN